MQKQSIRSLSILGLVLLAVSAVTAAMTSKKTDNSNDNRFALGSITNKAGVASSWSCSTTATPDGIMCNASTASPGTATTAAGGASSNNQNSGLGGAGANNTTTAA